VLTSNTAYDYVELTREVVNDVENDAASRFSGDMPGFEPREKRNKSIPLMDARMFAGQSSHQ
jgi:Amt family ammonium transporter